jgi:hypothetical protein
MNTNNADRKAQLETWKKTKDNKSGKPVISGKENKFLSDFEQKLQYLQKEMSDLKEFKRDMEISRQLIRYDVDCACL